MIDQCLNGFFFTWSLGTGLLSRTLGLPGQRGVVVILQDDQVWGGVLLAILGFQLICPVREGFIVRQVAGSMSSSGLFPVLRTGTWGLAGRLGNPTWGGSLQEVGDSVFMVT